MVPRLALALVVVLAGCAAGNGGGPARTNPTAVAGADRLEVTSSYDGKFGLELIDESSGETVLARTHPPGASIAIGDELEPGVTYRAVVTVEDEVAWNRSIYDYESYSLAIRENGSVRVDEYSEV